MAGASGTAPVRRAGQQPEPEPWRRALVAAAIAISVFTLAAVPTWFLIPFGVAGDDGWADLGYFAMLFLFLMATPVVALAFAFTAGKAVDERTRHQSTARAVAWLAQVAAIPAVLATLVALVTSNAAPWLPFVNLIVPAAIAGAVARLGVARVLRSRAGTMAVVLVTVILASAPVFLFALLRMGSFS